jgi:hypothetical protein
MKTDIWCLTESLRIPIGTTGWESAEPLSPSFDEAAQKCAFARSIKPRKAAETLAAVGRMIAEDPELFETAATAISPEGFRQLYHRGTYVLDCLVAPRFQADQTLRTILEQPDLFEDAPGEWLGTESDLGDLADETNYALRQMGVKPACAVWAILSAVQCLPLSKNEILHCRWFTPAWLLALATHLQIK